MIETADMFAKLFYRIFQLLGKFLVLSNPAKSALHLHVDLMSIVLANINFVLESFQPPDVEIIM